MGSAGEPRPVVQVIGLGPAGPDLLTAAATQLVERVDVQRLRTRRHPAASALPDAAAYDSTYDAADTIDEVYRQIVEALVGDAREHGEVLYAVPGSPVVAERTVELLLADARVEVVLHPAMSFLDLAWARLGVDPVELGVRLVDGHRFATAAAGLTGPMLVAQCDHRFVLSDVKLSIEDTPDVSVTLLQRLGLPDERIVEVPWSEMDRTVEPDHLTSLWIPELDVPVGPALARVEQLLRRLRDEDPWKANQTHQSLQRYLLEEAHETLEAIDGYDPVTGDGAEELCSELGDLLYQVVFHAAIAGEAGWFTLADVVTGLHDKLVRRHPHVVDPDDTSAPGLDDLVEAWERDKQAELGRASVYDGIPLELPALARAAKVLRKATPSPASGGSERVGERLDDAELGGALWRLVEKAHDAGLDAESALRRRTDRVLAELREVERPATGE